MLVTRLTGFYTQVNQARREAKARGIDCFIRLSWSISDTCNNSILDQEVTFCIPSGGWIE